MSDVQALDLTNEAYHARPEWSSSQVKLLPNEVELFHRRHIEKHPAFQFKQTVSTKLGTDVHSIVLEGTPIVMIPESVLSKIGSKAGNNWKAFVEDNPGKVLCKTDDPILHMTASIRNEPAAMKWLDAEGPVEYSLVYSDNLTGLALRARFDKFAASTEGSVIVDIKSTTKDPHNEREIARVIYDLGYHRSAAWYWDAAEKAAHVDVAAFVFVFVRNSQPYDCHVWELSGTALELGQLHNRRALSELAVRLQTKTWKPEAFGRTSIINLPEWAYKQEDTDHDD